MFYFVADSDVGDKIAVLVLRETGVMTIKDSTLVTKGSFSTEFILSVIDFL